jgi:Uma2 family endonuclease
MVSSATKYVTPEDYLAFEINAVEKHEYADGYIYSMAGASIPHNFIVANLMTEIGSFLKNKECFVLPSDVRIVIPNLTSYMYPDVTVFCGLLEKQPDGFDTLINPSVIIEVFSTSTRGIDKGMKLIKYLQIPSLKEYIIIDADRYWAQTIIKQDDHSFRINYTIGVAASIFIDSIQMSLPMSDVYARVSIGSEK